MTEVLDEPEIRDRMYQISVETYQRLIDDGVFDSAKVELIGGVLFKKMSKTKLHIHIVKVLFRQLLGFVDKALWEVQKEDPLKLAVSEPEPDISVIPLNISDAAIPEKPTTAQFVVEVAVTSISLDRAKSVDYASANIPEYWIVMPKERKVEVYRRPEEGVYSSVKEFDAKDEITSVAFEGFRFRLADYL